MGVQIRVTVEVSSQGKNISHQVIDVTAGDVAGAVDLQAAILRAANQQPPSPSPGGPDSHPGRPLQRDPQPPGLFPSPSTPPAGAIAHGHPRIAYVQAVIDDDDLHETMHGLTATDIVRNTEVNRAIAMLDLIGYADPWAAVLEHGPPRCIELVQTVRRWRSNGQAHRNPAGLVFTMLKKGPPKGAQEKKA